VAQALLPAMASAFRLLPEDTAGLLRRGALMIMLLTLPPCLILAGFAETALRLWLGAGFAAESAMVLRILAGGIFFSCLAYAPGAPLDAIGRPDVTAKFMLAQVVVFLPLSAAMLLGFGIEGAALAWAVRAAVDAGGKLFFAARLYPAAAAAPRALLPALLAAAAALELGEDSAGRPRMWVVVLGMASRLEASGLAGRGHDVASRALLRWLMAEGVGQLLRP